MQVYLGVAGGCKKRDGSARELREMATSTRQLVMVREKKAAAPTWRLLLGWTLAAGEFRPIPAPSLSVVVIQRSSSSAVSSSQTDSIRTRRF